MNVLAFRRCLTLISGRSKSLREPAVHISDRGDSGFQGIIPWHDGTSDRTDHAVGSVGLVRKQKLHAGGSEHQHHLSLAADSTARHACMRIYDACTDSDPGHQSKFFRPFLCKMADTASCRTDLTAQLLLNQVLQSRIQFQQHFLRDVSLLRRPHRLICCHVSGPSEFSGQVPGQPVTCFQKNRSGLIDIRIFPEHLQHLRQQKLR